MIYNKTATLKNGLSCLLRSPSADDAEDILRHLAQTSDETGFMLRYGDEITMTPEEEKIYLDKIESDPKAVMISAIIEGEFAANSGINPAAPAERCRHRAEFGISVKRRYWGVGIGAALLSANIEAARAAGYTQLELEVVAGNSRAISLYEKFGFRIYGTRPKSFVYRDGSYAAEHLMLLELQ